MVLLNDKRTLDSLKRYFKTLQYTGYVSPQSTKRLLVLTFLNSWINSDMSYFIYEDDYNMMAKLLRDITGDCLIPYSSYCTRMTKIGSPMPFGTSVFLRNRLSQQGDARYAETSEVRIAEGATTLDKS